MEKTKKERTGMERIVLTLFFLSLIAFVSAAQCNDGIDNDLDGTTDYPTDAGCSSATDTTEALTLGYADGCLSKGQSLKTVHGVTTYTCSSTSCFVCVLMTESGNYTTLPSKCTGLTKCGFGNGGGSGGSGGAGPDVSPPNITISKPTNGTVYNARAIDLSISLDELADVYYLDLDRGRGKWTKVCTSCSSYSGKRSFSEGSNNLTFRAKDAKGNTAYKNLSFTIDSQKPKVKSAEPSKGFANGTFKLEADELNPTKITLNYGNALKGYKNSTLNLGTDCLKEGAKLSCNKTVDLTIYDEQNITYWFEVKDIANNIDNSKNNTLDVDKKNPILNNPNNFSTRDGEFVYFNFNITEKNFKEVSYIDEAESNSKSVKLCTKLVNGICEKKVHFRDGQHNLTITILDEAGNSIQKKISFLLDSVEPKIGKIIPTKGFVSGEFEVSFTEENPKELTLHYGNDSYELDIDNECELDGRGYTCMTNVNLSKYDGKKIEFWFTLTDVAENEDESKHYNIDVDTTFPVLKNPTGFFNVSGRDVYFKLNVTEKNFEEASYSYLDSRGRGKDGKLCTKLKNGLCEKKVRFTEGNYDLTIQISDKAGNAIATSAKFNITA